MTSSKPSKTKRGGKPVKKVDGLINDMSTKFPTAGITEWRSPMFPVGRKAAKVNGSKTERAKAAGVVVKKNSPTTIIKSPFGEVRFEVGCLTAADRDLLDAVIASKDFFRFSQKSGRMEVVFDPAKVKKMLGVSFDYPYRDIHARLLRIQSVVLSIRLPGDDWGTSFGLIESVGDYKVNGENQIVEHGSGKYNGTLKSLKFTTAGVKLMAIDTHLCVNSNVIEKILDLENQVSRAVARWFLTHKEDQVHGIKNVLRYVGVDEDSCSDRMIRKYVADLREDSKKLAQLNISVNNDTISYTRNSGVFISTEPFAGCVIPGERDQNPEPKSKGQQ